MTFEEFFSKKRIDLVQLEQAEPTLYAEFKSHFILMGEKSFDHSKKFWFNKLRHFYHLDTPAKQVAPQLETKIALQAESLSSPTMDQTAGSITALRSSPPVNEQSADAAQAPSVDKPRFKPRAVQAKAASSTEAQKPAEQSVSEQEPLPVKKPPFKPRNIKPLSGGPSEDAQKVESRPGQTEIANTQDSPLSSPVQAESAKPGYKPKFNIRKISRTTPDAAGKTSNEEDQQITPCVPEADSVPEESPAKPAYKPRFDVKNVTKKTEPGGVEDKTTSEEALPAPSPEASSELPETPREKETGREEGETKPKPAYKPRFNAGNIKPKKED